VSFRVQLPCTAWGYSLRRLLRMFLKKTHMLWRIHRCNPNQLGGFACAYVNDFPIEVNPILRSCQSWIFHGHSLLAYCQIPPRRVISDPHLLEQYPPLHPISGANGLILISPYAGPLFRSPRSGHWWNPYICPGDYTLSCDNLCSNRLSGDHVIFWGIDSVNENKEKERENRIWGGEDCPLPCPVLGEAPTLPPPNFHHNPIRAPTYVEGEKKIFYLFNSTERFIVISLTPYLPEYHNSTARGSRDQLTEHNAPVAHQIHIDHSF
jgi:hypothetical protein